jgi:arylsulfatase A-like enzyme
MRIVAFALFAVALLGACAPDEAPPRHVLLITVDTLRADHLSVYGYPRATSDALAELAERSVVFERAIAQWPKTGPSFASLFTGLYPQTTGLTHRAAIELPDEYLTLAELFSAGGFVTAAVVSNGVLRRELGWNQGFDQYLETWKLSPVEVEDPVEYRRWVHAGRVNELALPLLDRLKDSERLFLWLHYSDPHAPYILPEGVENPFVGDPWYVGDQMVKLESPRRAKAVGDNPELRHYVAHYDANIRYTDLKIRELLDHAGKLGLLDDALVAFTADHGESLGEHDYFFGHGRLPYNASAHVPLLLSYPRRTRPARRVASPVELVDLYPTLRRLAVPELEVPGLEGRSLEPFLEPGDVDGDAAGAFRYAFAQAGGGGGPRTHFRSVQDRRFKLIYHPPRRTRRGGEKPPHWELYDLEDDPMETRDLLAEERREGQRLRTELFAWMKGSDWIIRRPEQIEARSQEALKALKALGYVE